MDNIYNSIAILCQKNGISISKMCQLAGISSSTIYDLKSGKKNGVSLLTAKKIAAALSTTVDELHKEKGTDDNVQPEIIELPPINMDGNSKEANNSNVIPMKQSLTNGGKIKVLGAVPAGIPIEAIECVIDEIDISERMANDSHEYFGLLVSGNSMYPEYLDGDIVIVRQQSTADTGDDVVAYVNGYDATLKRLQIMSGGIRLKALNPQYESKFYSNDDVINMPVSILGVVVEMRRTRKL